MTRPKDWVRTFTPSHEKYFARMEAEIERCVDDPRFQEILRETLAQAKHDALTVKGWRAPRARDMRHYNLWDGLPS